MTDRHLDGLVNLPNTQARFGLVHIGTVSRVEGTDAFVIVPALAPGFAFGPCDLRGLGPTDSASANGPDPHTHGLRSAVTAGDVVLVAFVAGDQSRPVILRRLETD